MNLKLPAFFSNYIAEGGGAFHTDGNETLIAVEQCLLNNNRNAFCAKAEIEAELKARLGASKIIWLYQGLFEYRTDGYAGNVACFVKHGLILMQTCSNIDEAALGIIKELFPERKIVTINSGSLAAEDYGIPV